MEVTGSSPACTASLTTELSLITRMLGCKVTVKCVNLFLSPACARRPWSGDYETPSVSSSVRASVRPFVMFLHKP